MHTGRTRLASLAGTLAVAVSSLPAQAAPATPKPAAEAPIVVSGATYQMRIEPEGFRYAFHDPSGAQIVPAHAESGLRLRPAGASEFVDAADTRLISNPRAATAVLDVTMEDGSHVRVHVHPSASSVRLTVKDLPGESSTVDFRTGHVAPAYGLGDYGSFADGQPEQGTPCSGAVEVRPTTELTGLVLDDLTNEGSCKRFITNFTVFPKQRFGQVWFEDGQKRVGLSDTENRLGAAGVDGVDGLYYFIGRDLRQVYADYKRARKAHGYLDARPDPDFFGLGWEAYGALAWNTYQSSVEETVQAFVDHGYPLSWGVVGSGFWPGPRGNPVEGTTNSFGMWDDTAEPDRDDGLPNPRYPDPDRLKQLFAGNGIALLLGARNNFKALPEDGGNHNERYDGDFVHEAIERGYLLTDPDGSPTVVTRAQFPSGASYVLDGSDPKAVDWYIERLRAWGVDGWKEDTMLYAPNLYRDGNWNPVELAMHRAGDLVMVRNAAYSVPGDILRINDTIYGTGEVYHEDPDRIPVNLLNYAASGVGNLYPDYVGGTPGPSLTDPSYQKYFMRNAQFDALMPVMAFGRGPWELARRDFAAAVKRLALWHESLRPYIYDAVLDGHRTGFPAAVTPLPIAYPDDPATYDLANRETRQYEWMFGPSLLATPVFGSDFETAQTRDVYLPAGKWIDIESGAVFHGPTTLEDYPIGFGRIPAFAGGKGVIVTGTPGELRASVYPVSLGTDYTLDNGKGSSTITNANTGWDPESLIVIDVTTHRPVEFDVDPVTGAIEFDLTLGHDYRLQGGGTADHSVPLDTDPPAQVTGLTHHTEDGVSTLTWSPAAGARGYVVTVSGQSACGDDPEHVLDSTTGSTSIALGPAETAGGTYRVYAVNNRGSGPYSEPYRIDASGGDDPGPVVVTNEGDPPTCDPEHPAYAETGSWASSSLKGFDDSGTRYSSTAGSTATWNAVLEPGTYEVAAWYPQHTVCSTDATFTVRHADGATDIAVDQCATGGDWHDLGTFTADGLTSVTLTVNRGTTRADAVRFSPLEGAGADHAGVPAPAGKTG